MTRFNRWIGYLKSWFGVGLPMLENPDVLIDQAVREMAEMHARSHERADRAVDRRNELQQVVDHLEQEGPPDAVPLAAARAALTEAIAAATGALAHLQQEQELIERKTAEAHQLKAQWNAACAQREAER